MCQDRKFNYFLQFQKVKKYIPHGLVVFFGNLMLNQDISDN